jgi:hypothetical protein
MCRSLCLAALSCLILAAAEKKLAAAEKKRAAAGKKANADKE